MSRPLIGITIGYSSQNREFFTLRDDYVRAIEKAGGPAGGPGPGPRGGRGATSSPGSTACS